MLLVVAQSLLLAASIGDSEVPYYTQSHGKPHIDVPRDKPHALDLGTRGAAESWAMAHPMAAGCIHTFAKRFL
jgi:hypothetical protein